MDEEIPEKVAITEAVRVGKKFGSPEAGKFVNNSQLQFMDFKHFNGNQTFIGAPQRYNYSFFMLPYYEFSTSESYLEIHFQH